MKAPWRAEWRMSLTSGGSLLVREWGDPDGPLVVFHHGTPSSSIAVPGGWDSAARGGARLCSFDRPGYGGSDRQAGRAVADAAEWTVAVADAVGRERFAVVGTSGGGPHAAAAAACAPGRVAALGLIVSLGPYPSPDAVVPGMLAETEDEICAARQGEHALRAMISSLGGVDEALDGWMALLPPSDAEVLSRPEVQREEGVEHDEWSVMGIDGWVDDDLALFARPWGFAVETIRAPTMVLFGGADVLVPPAHAHAWGRALPHAAAQEVAGGGHWLRDHEAGVVDWLAEQVRLSERPAHAAAVRP